MTSRTSVSMRRECVGPRTSITSARHILHGDQSGAHRVVEIVIDVGDAIGDADDLAFERIRPGPPPLGHSGAGLGVAEDSVADGIGEVQSAAFSSPDVDDTQALLVVAKAGKGLGQRRLPGVAERRVTEIVTEADRLDQIFVQSERAADRASDLRHFEGVGQARPVVIAGGRDENLGLVHQAAKALGVEDAVAVALKGGPQLALWIRSGARGAATASRRRQQIGLFPLFEELANRGHEP